MSSTDEPSEIWALRKLLKKLVEAGWDPLGPPESGWTHEKNQELLREYGCMFLFDQKHKKHFLIAASKDTIDKESGEIIRIISQCANFDPLAAEVILRLTESKLCS